jgi:hypothetical protein
MMQRINISQEEARCENCGTDLLDIRNIKYTEKAINKPTYREEFCLCKKCGDTFILHYDIFDKEGHVEPRVFSGDINNPEYNWPDNLTQEQRDTINEHLKICSICVGRADDELLSDAWMAGIIHNKKV